MLSWRIWADDLINRIRWKYIEITSIESTLRYKLRLWLFWSLNSNKYSSSMSFRKKANPYSILVKLEINDIIISNHFACNNWHYIISRGQYKRRAKLGKFEAHNIFNGAMSNDGAGDVELAIVIISTSLSW